MLRVVEEVVEELLAAQLLDLSCVCVCVCVCVCGGICACQCQCVGERVREDVSECARVSAGLQQSVGMWLAPSLFRSWQSCVHVPGACVFVSVDVRPCLWLQYERGSE